MAPTTAIILRSVAVLAAFFTGTPRARAADAVRPNTAPSRVTIDSDTILSIDGRKVFPIGFTMAPPPGAKSPRGVEGLRELREAGALMLRSGPMGKEKWDEAGIAREREWMDAAARNGMYAMPWLKEFAAVPGPDAPKAADLRRIVSMFKDHPGMGIWKGEDEPEWGKKPVPPLRAAYDIIHQIDPNHPVWIVQAPRGSIETLRPYNETYDIGGIDIYPISYPPGVHSNDANKEISMVGDFAQRIAQTLEGKKPFWMTLQIAFSGTVKPGKTLRFPTFHEQRFMTYQAIINGARGIVYFGGQLPQTLNERDTPLGWNWTYWDDVLRRMVEEIGDHSPLQPALVAANSKQSVQVVRETSAAAVECLVRETADHWFLLACKRSGATDEVEFTGLPPQISGGEVLFEAPRKVQANAGRLKDWFAPYEVHVYRFPKR
jgi:hypothetical protein